MIKHLTRKELDVQKYDKCIYNAVNTRIYAYSWYLDIVCDNWDVLVKDDYVAVMPLPKRKKYGINYIYQAPWIQQLGIFSSTEISQMVISSFIKKTPSIFLLYYNFNAQNMSLTHGRKSVKINYELSLNKTYDNIFKNYRKDRKKSLRKATESKLYFDDKNNVKELIKLYREVFPLLNIKDESFKNLYKLVEFCLSENYGFQRNIYMQNQIVARGFFLHFRNRIYYLFGASNKQGKKTGATTFMVDSVLKQFEKTDNIFDFEGSSIPSIGNFYKSFGATNAPYPVFGIRKGMMLIKKLLQ